MRGASDSATRQDECSRCFRATTFRVAGALQSWTCTNCGTNNVVDEAETRGAIRIPVIEPDDSPDGEDPSIH